MFDLQLSILQSLQNFSAMQIQLVSLATIMGKKIGHAYPHLKFYCTKVTTVMFLIHTVGPLKTVGGKPPLNQLLYGRKKGQATRESSGFLHLAEYIITPK